MSEVSFKVGDHVVYPAHGVGQVTGKEKQAVGEKEISVYVVSFAKDKMVLRVPVGRAKKVGLRSLSTKDQVTKAVKTLKGKAKMGRGMWSRRAQEYEQKINSGDIVQIAEVVRDLHKNVDDPDRSYSERMIYESALDRLTGEYAAVNDSDPQTAATDIVTILKSKEKAKKAEDQEDVAA